MSHAPEEFVGFLSAGLLWYHVPLSGLLPIAGSLLMLIAWIISVTGRAVVAARAAAGSEASA